MSRLADLLMGMDRGSSRPEGVGGIPRLATPGEATPKWRRGVVLVILVGMLAAVPLTAVFLHYRSAAPPAPRLSTSVVPPAPAPSPSRSSTAEQRYLMLVGQGLQAAQEGELSEAARLLRKALELKPRDAETWNSLGVVLVRQGQTAAGMDAFHEALHLDANHPEAQRNLAVALDREGRSSEAVTHYQAFLRVSAENHPARDAVRRRLAAISSSRPGE